MAKQKQFNHIHTLILAASAVMLVMSFLVVSSSRSQASKPQTDANKQVNKQNCDSKGNPVINVSQKVTNTVDSGEGGNYWAFEDYTRHIQVWQETDNTFCVLVDYDGKFDSQEGQKSPGNTGILTGSEDGNFKGGYRATITGALKDTPDFKTNGSIGTTNYNCDINANCPGAFNWVTKYFSPESTFSYDWWGWSYHTAGNKTWINSSDGNSGDIL